MTLLIRLLSVLTLAIAFFTNAVSAQETQNNYPKTHLKIVGGLSNLSQYRTHENPFWTATIPALSNGQISVDIKGYNEMGLKGQEVLRLLSQGVLEFATATLVYFASDDAINELIDLPGIATDIKTARQITDAFFPIYDQHYRSQFGVKILGLGTYPAQVLFCNANIGQLSDIKGKKVRTSSRGQAELIEALGGTSVTLAFAEVVPALQNKVVDCAITGSLSGNQAKWHEVTSHLYALPVNWNQTLHAVNLKSWNKIAPSVQSLIEAQYAILIDQIWQDAAYQTQQGYACNAGLPSCHLGIKGKMTLVEPKQADYDLLQEIARTSILPKWSARCSADCVAKFNQVIKPITGLTAQK